MKAEEVSLIGGIGAVSGALIREKTPLKTGNAIIDAVVGAIILGAGWFMDMDGIGDFVEGFGVGYLVDSII